MTLLWGAGSLLEFPFPCFGRGPTTQQDVLQPLVSKVGLNPLYLLLCGGVFAKGHLHVGFKWSE